MDWFGCSTDLTANEPANRIADRARDDDLWRHVSWDRHLPHREVKDQFRWGWIFYRRVKTGKTFYRPMNRFVHAHVKSIMPDTPCRNDPVSFGGGSHPNRRFQQLCDLAGIKSKTSFETGEESPWPLKDLRKTCATYYDEQGGHKDAIF